MTHPDDSVSDDELINRLKAASGTERTRHDPYLDLPIAKEAPVSGDESCADVQDRCNAPGRRSLPVQGYFDVAATEPVACELRAGHEGSHRAHFTRTKVRHHWQALEWTDGPST